MTATIWLGDRRIVPAPGGSDRRNASYGQAPACLQECSLRSARWVISGTPDVNLRGSRGRRRDRLRTDPAPRPGIPHRLPEYRTVARPANGVVATGYIPIFSLAPHPSRPRRYFSMSSTTLSRKIVERTIGEKHISLETGRLAKQASGRGHRADRRHHVAGDLHGGAGPGGARLLPADRRLPGEDLRRGQVPRRVHQARGAAHQQGDPHRPADRPADPAALPRVVSRGGPDPGRADLGRPAE